jgi:ABC-type lipoprotein export system ATPase subunit
MSLLSFKNVSKTIRDGTEDIAVLADVSFEIDPGDYVGLWGGRQSGKSTMLRLAAGIEQPDAGAIIFDGKDITKMSDDERAELRRGGGIARALLDWTPTGSRPVVEHIALPIVCGCVTFNEAEQAARRALKRVGAADLQNERTDRLKLSERIRVELARALAREPRLLLVDEPAMLASPSASRELYALLRSLGRDRTLAVVIASQEAHAIEGAPRVFSIDNGRVRTTDSRRKVLQFPRAAESAGT